MWGYASANMYRELTDGDDDYLKDVFAISLWAGATGALWMPEVGSYIVGRSVSGIGVGMRAGARLAAPYAGAAVTAAAPVVVGYAIGAVVGTAIANEVWGEEGAQTAMGFYSGGLLPGTEAPDLTDYQYIFKPTAPGGPVSLYDVAEAGVKTTLTTGHKLWKKRPRLRLGMPLPHERRWF
jgi:hypothetical protein